MKPQEEPACPRRIRDCLLLALLIVHLSQFAFRGIVLDDEGDALLTASALMEGKTLFTDLPSGTLGGTYYLQVAAFRVFGRTLASQRIVTLAADLIICAAVIALARRGVGVVWGPFFALAGCVCALSFWFATNYAHWSVAWILVATALEWRSRRTGRMLDSAMAGLCLAAAFLFKHNIALYAAAGLVAAHALALVGRTESGRARGGTLAGLLMGGALGGGIVCSVLLIQGNLLDMWNMVFNLSAIENFIRAQGSPLPSPALLVLPPSSVRSAYRMYEAWDQFLPLILSLAAIAKLVSGRIHRRPWGLPDQDLLCCVLVTFAVYANAFPRADRMHTMFALVPAAILAGLLLLPRSQPDSSLWRARLRRGSVGLLIAFAAVHVLEPWVIFRRSTTPLWGAASDIRVATDQAQNLRAVQEIVSSHVPPGSAILCLPHWPLAYILFDRPTPFDGLSYCYAQAKHGTGYVRERLVAHPPRVVVQSVRRSPFELTATDSSGWDVLRWLDEGYVVVREDSVMRVWLRR